MKKAEEKSIAERRKVSAGQGSSLYMSIVDIKKNIILTVAYYDGMDWPMTAFEIWKHMLRISNFPACQSLALAGRQFPISNEVSGSPSACSLGDVINALDDYSLKRLIKEQDGFFFLRGRSDLVGKRIRNDKTSARKLKKIMRYVYFLRLIPFVRMIGLTGGLAMKNANEESDWDILVILKKGKIWTGRFLVTAFLQLVGRRRHGTFVKDRFCLNHFLADEKMQVSTRELYPLFCAHEFSFMFPVFDTGVFQGFQLQNLWIRDWKPNYEPDQFGVIFTKADNSVSKLARQIGEMMAALVFSENWMRKWQKKKIMKNPKTNIPGSFIKTTDDALVFLPEPHGEELLEHLRKTIDKMGGI